MRPVSLAGGIALAAALVSCGSGHAVETGPSGSGDGAATTSSASGAASSSGTAASAAAPGVSLPAPSSGTPLDAGSDAGPGGCHVPNNRGILEDGDALFAGGAVTANVVDFDGDGCADGSFSIRSDARAILRTSLSGEAAWTANASGASQTMVQIAQIADWSGDGVPDAIALVREPTTQACAGTVMNEETFLFVDGKSGAVATPVSPIADTCWTFATTTYATVGLYGGSVFVSDFVAAHRGLEVYIFPYYATQGYALNFAGTGTWTTLGAETDPALQHLIYPSTASYDPYYDAANATPCMTSPWNAPSCFTPNSEAASGLALDDGNLFLLTSGRAFSYRPDLSATGDLTWASGGRTDHAGRDYGLVSHFHDAAGGENVTLHGGCEAASMVDAIEHGALDLTHGDYYCGIHRHFERFAIAAGVASAAGHANLFYSYADVDGQTNRLQYPSHAVFVPPAGAPFTAFDLYDGARWHVLTGDPRDPTTFASALDDAFLWDLRDLDGDGVPEGLVSLLPPGSSGTASLVPPRTVSLVRFSADAGVTMLGTFDGWLPTFAAAINGATRTSSDGFLENAVVTDADGDGVLEPVIVDAAGAFARLVRRPAGDPVNANPSENWQLVTP